MPFSLSLPRGYPCPATRDTTSPSRIYTGPHRDSSERVVRFHTRAYRSLRRNTFCCRTLLGLHSRTKSHNCRAAVSLPSRCCLAAVSLRTCVNSRRARSIVSSHHHDVMRSTGPPFGGTRTKRSTEFPPMTYYVSTGIIRLLEYRTSLITAIHHGEWRHQYVAW
jgi:hypothetical protein